jgi:Tfp pilus assembly protein PilE
MKIRRRPQEAGLTLLELVVVLAILVALTTAVAAKLDFFQVRANKGIAASNMVDVARFVQSYYISQNHLPNNWDSLCASGTGDLWQATTLTAQGLDPELPGGPVGGSPQKLKTFTIQNDATGQGYLRSLQRMGITQVLDVDAALAENLQPGNRFNITRSVEFGGSFATPNVQIAGTTLTGDEDAVDMMKSFYPKTAGIPDDGFTVVVFGLGPLNDLIGNHGLIAEAPVYTNTGGRGQYYDRYLVAFEIGNGKRARLLGVLGADGDTLASEIGDYYDPNY